MSLSLEVKKFINSEHTGEYVSVVLPSELPVDKSEVREVNRDKAAAAAARNYADDLSKKYNIARDNLENTKTRRNEKIIEAETAKAAADEADKLLSRLSPPLEAKKSSYESVHSNYLEKNSDYESKAAAFREADSAKTECEKALYDAVQHLNECRVHVEEAEKALSDEKNNSSSLSEQLSKAASDAAEAAEFSKAAADTAETLLKSASDKETEMKELTQKVTQLLAFSKNAAKRVADVSKSNAAAHKELTKVAAELSSAKEGVSAAESIQKSAGKSSSSSGNDALKNKLNNLRQKAAGASAKYDSVKAAADKSDEELALTTAAASDAEREYQQANEALSILKSEFENIKAQADSANEKSLSAKAKLTSQDTAHDGVKSSVEASSERIKGLEQRIIDTKTALLNAESEEKDKKFRLEVAEKTASSAEKAMNEASKTLSEVTVSDKAAEEAYIAEKTSYQAEESKVNALKDKYNALNDELIALNAKLDVDTVAAEKAKEAMEKAEEEAVRLQYSIRTIETRFETAKIHYMQQGKGEDILLIHSVGQSLYTFRELITKLSSNFRVTALDLVGFGYSEKPYIFGYTMDEMADSIGRFMDAIGIGSAHILGFSMGAGFTVNFAKRYPERVEKLILLSPGGITPDMPLSVRMMESSLLGGLAVRLYSFKTVEKLLGECFFDLTNLTDDLANEYYRPVADSEARRVIRTCLANFDDESVIHSLRDIKAETLILWGNEDKWHPTEMSNIFQAALPNCTFTLVRNAGHLAHEEKADRVSKLIKSFIPCGLDD